jgi:hypothetical protein
MNKIPTLFERDFSANNGRFVIVGNVTPGCEWVLSGEGTATRKYDGTCVMLRDGTWFARREVKRGKPEPANFEPLSTDPETGKTVGWEPVEQSGFTKWHAEARHARGFFTEGTYELCGPKVNGNPESFAGHVLIKHLDAERYPAMNAPQSADELVTALLSLPWEGLVWQHPDGRMAKLKRRDLSALEPIRAVTG